MTISSTTRIAGPFIGTGVATVFPFTFKVFAAGDLQVVRLTVSTGLQATLVLNSDYTVSLNQNQDSNPGGSVTLTGGALASGFTLTITSDIANLQPTDITNQGGFYPEVIEDSLDRATIQIQQMSQDVGRSLKAPLSDGTPNMEMPNAANRAGKYLVFDPNGLPTVSGGSGTDTALRTDLSNTSVALAGASLVGFRANDASSTGRTVLDKLREWVTLADFNGNLATALTAFGSNATTFVINQDVTIAANTTIPSTVNVWVENGAVITVNSGVTLTINGPFLGYTNQVFAGSGIVVFAATSVAAVLPEWFGAKADNSTDCTTAFAKTFAAATDTGLISGASILPVKLQSGTYVVGNVILPAASQLYGAGKWITALKCKASTTGYWITDNGNANKIILDGIGFYGNSEAGVTVGIRLGRGANPHGTEGAIRNVHVRDLPNATGIDVLSNVSAYDNINVWSCQNGFYVDGPHATCSNMVAYACTGTSAKLNLVTMQGLEIEAPATGSLPLDMTGNCTIDGLTMSLANSTTISHLVEQRAACVTWSIQGLQYLFPGSPSGIVVSNGNIKLANGTYVGGNASSANAGGEGNYSSSTFAVNGQRLQCFKTRITNTGGTLQHRVDETSGNLYCTMVNAASTTLQNTPTGADATTPFAFGGKIGSASTSVFTFDTAAQPSNGPLFTANIVFNNIGVAYTVIPFLESKNINGVTLVRPALQLVTLSGVATAWSTALSTPGAMIDIQIMWFIA